MKLTNNIKKKLFICEKRRSEFCGSPLLSLHDFFRDTGFSTKTIAKFFNMSYHNVFRLYLVYDAHPVYDHFGLKGYVHEEVIGVPNETPDD